MNFAETYAAAPLVLTEGAIGTRLESEYGLRHHPVVTLAIHATTSEGRKALADVWTGYARVAHDRGLPILIASSTRRANRARLDEAGLPESILNDNVNHLKSVLAGLPAKSFVGGTLGSSGNSYTGDTAITEDQSRDLQSWSVERYAKTGVDYLYAGIMPALPEIVGLARACSEAEIPCIVSLMLRPDGTLPDGSTLHDVIARTDAAVKNPPLCYSANCVYPDVVGQALSAEANRTPLVRERFLGVMPNASPLPVEELDGCGVLHQTSPETLAASVGELTGKMTVRVLGGCCGTDDRHLAVMADRVLGERKD